MRDFFAQLEDIHRRPEPFAFYTAADLWTDQHTSAQMLAHHLDPDIDVSSYRGAFIDASVRWIGAHFQVGPHTRIADFGCGPGLYAHRLAASGGRVTGIDFSQRSIEHARKAAAEAGLAIEFVNQDYLEYKTEDRFDLVLMIMCDFCALSPAQRMGLLQKFHTLLVPGGAVLLDVCSLHTFDRREEATVYGSNLQDGFWSPAAYYGFCNTFKYHDAKVVLDKYTIVEAARVRTVYNWMQYFSPESLWNEFSEAGFSRHALYGDVTGAAFDPDADGFAIVAG